MKIDCRIDINALKKALKLVAKNKSAYAKIDDSVVFIIGGYAAIKTNDPFVIDVIKEGIKSLVGFVPDTYFEESFSIYNKESILCKLDYLNQIDEMIASANKEAIRTDWKVDMTAPKKRFESRLFVIDGDKGNHALVDTAYESIFDPKYKWYFFGKDSLAPIIFSNEPEIKDAMTVGLVLPVRTDVEANNCSCVLSDEIRKLRGI